MKFFVDNNVSLALARAMHALSEPFGHETWHLTQRFRQDTDDLEWIDTLSNEGGWSVITHDKLNKGLEREALREARLIVFFLDKGWAHHHYWDTQSKICLERRADLTRAGIGRAALALTCRSDSDVARVLPGPTFVT